MDVIRQRLNEKNSHSGTVVFMASYIIIEILNAFEDAHGQPGRQTRPLEGYDKPMSEKEGREALKAVTASHEGEFTLRVLSDVLTFPGPEK